MSTSAGRRRGPAVAAGLLAGTAALLAGCSSTSGTGTPATSTPVPSSAVGGASYYASIAELDSSLEAKGITCKLEYPGLKDDTQKVELSICVIDGEQAFLKIWADTAQLRQFVTSPDGNTGTVAVGANWTVTVSSSTVAAKVAAALGGTAPGAAASSTSPTR